MELVLQNLNLAIPKTKSLFLKNPNRSVSASFRHLRKQLCFSSIGDYPILSALVSTVTEMNIIPSRTKLTHSLNQSEELKELTKGEKIALLNQLIKPLNNQLKLTKNPLQDFKSQKLTSTSSEQFGGHFNG